MTTKPIRVGVLRGGPSSEYDVSLKTGEFALKHLPRERFEPLDVLIDKEGKWHYRGRIEEPARVLADLDAVFIALHGAFGEDGKVQRLLEDFKKPFTGSGSMASMLGMQKPLAKEYFRKRGLKTPWHVVVERGEHNLERAVNTIARQHDFPMVVKPVDGGSSIGTSLVTDHEALRKALEFAFEYSNKVMVEQCIIGKEATVGVIEGLGGEKALALEPIEIAVPLEKEVFDYETKYEIDTSQIEKIPGDFSHEERGALMHLAKEAHEAIGARHYSRSDFMVAEDGVYILEINTLPGLTEQSLVPKALREYGMSEKEFLTHLVDMALTNQA